MNNPWEDINLSVYENHMALESVGQLQAMNQMMKTQLNQYDLQSAMILGIANFTINFPIGALPKGLTFVSVIFIFIPFFIRKTSGISILRI